MYDPPMEMPNSDQESLNDHYEKEEEEMDDDSTPCIVAVLLFFEPITWIFWMFFGWRTALFVWFLVLINNCLK